MFSSFILDYGYRIACLCRDAMKINYFDDKELIKSHIEKYKNKGE